MTAIGEIRRGAYDFRAPATLLRGRVSPLLVAYAGFIILGLGLITNSQVTSDGGWDLYGRALERGVRLYSDLKLPQQPLFILMTSAWQHLVGQSWLLSLVPAVVCLIFFATGFYLLARGSDWPVWQQAIVFFSAATVAIAWTGYRFDDYRVLTDIAAVYSVVVLLRLLSQPADSAAESKWPLILGILSGLAFTTRANDGLLLLISQGAILFYAFPAHRPRLLILLLAAFVATALAVIGLTGDSFAAYFRYTLLRSSDSKGGLQQVALTPFLLVADLIAFFFKRMIVPYQAMFIAAAAFPVAIGSRIRVSPGERAPLLAIVIAAGVVLFECLIVAYFNRLSIDCMASVVQPMLAIGLIGVSLWAAAAVLGLTKLENRTAVLFLVPFGALIAGAMSSGGRHLGLFGPVGLSIAIVPLVFKLEGRKPWGRQFFLCGAALLAGTIALGKIQQPYDWQYYHAQPMFMNRTVIDHPLYGPMIVNKRINRVFDKVCQIVRSSGPNPQLLSMPYSYANYYCGIEPWGGYIQTYYDTTSSETVQTIRDRLAHKPPTWVLYQRQLPVLRGNEVGFNHGRRSDYRNLDEFIVGQVSRGNWTLAGRWRERRYDDWLLIRTSSNSR